MEQRETVSREREEFREELREPRMFLVHVFNDDITTFEFVVHVMRSVFGKSEADGWRIAEQTHTRGKALVGRYTCDMAHTKVDKAVRLARGNGYPLSFTIEPEDRK